MPFWHSKSSDLETDGGWETFWRSTRALLLLTHLRRVVIEKSAELDPALPVQDFRERKCGQKASTVAQKSAGT